MVEDETRLDEEDREAVADRGSPVETEVGEEGEVLDLDAQEDDLEQVMRAATEAVESAEAEKRVDVARLEQELADLRDRSMRTLADFDNYRKRAERERREAKQFALLEPMRDLLDVVDNLERAMAAPGSVEDLRQGVQMILRQLDDLLRRYGVRPVEAEGEAFDPTIHEAVASRDSEEVEEATVHEEYQKGYLLHDRLLRPARVVVAVPSQDGSGGTDAGESSEEEASDPDADESAEEGGPAS